MSEKQDAAYGYHVWMEITSRYPDFEKHGGLIPVIVQDEDSGDVYPILYTMESELKETQRTLMVVYYSIYSKTKIDGVLRDGTVPIIKHIFVDSMGGSLLYLISQGKAKNPERKPVCLVPKCVLDLVNRLKKRIRSKQN